MNIIDTRDLDQRLDELVAKRDAIKELREELVGLEGDELATAKAKLEDAEADFDEDEQSELKELEELESEIPEWRHGNQLIHESYWVDYVKQLLEDIGDLPWYITIDWDATADNIKADYSECEYQGETYYYRNC